MSQVGYVLGENNRGQVGAVIKTTTRSYQIHRPPDTDSSLDLSAAATGTGRTSEGIMLAVRIGTTFCPKDDSPIKTAKRKHNRLNIILYKFCKNKILNNLLATKILIN